MTSPVVVALVAATPPTAGALLTSLHARAAHRQAARQDAAGIERTIGTLSAGLGRVETTLDRLDTQVAGMEATLHALSGGLGRVEAVVDRLEVGLGDLRERVARLEGAPLGHRLGA